jgi:hypothetical protein
LGSIDDEYCIRTRISERGSTIEASVDPVVCKRDKRTRTTRWEAAEDDIQYDADALDLPFLPERRGAGAGLRQGRQPRRRNRARAVESRAP